MNDISSPSIPTAPIGVSRRHALALSALGVGAFGIARFAGLGSSLTAATTVDAASACNLMVEVTQGPYYLDETTLVRQDITEGKAGTPLTLDFTIANATSCGPIAGAVVEIWHADATGTYSGYPSQVGSTGAALGTTFLRGTQVSDADGKVTFTTIFPGWYSGRAPHVHIKVHVGSTVHTGQAFFPDSFTTTVYGKSPYNTTTGTHNSGDNVYAQAGSAALLTMTTSGSGYIGVNTLGVTDASNSTGGAPTNDSYTPTTSPTTIGSPSAFVPLAVPARILDTRADTLTGYTGSKPAAGATVVVAIAGHGGVPLAGASAVVLNVTATEATAAGYVTAWPDGTRPATSNLNLEVAGQTRPNLVTIPIGADGSVRLYTQSGTHLIADVFGYYVAATSSTSGRFQPLTPGRLLDTRVAVGYTGSKPSAGTTATLPVLGQQGVPTTGVSAIVLTLTATEAEGPGYVSMWPEGTKPSTSVLNPESAGQTIANQVILPVGADGSVRWTTTVATHLVADVSGWYTTSTAAASTQGLFVPVSPYRVYDSRDLTKRTLGSTLTLNVASSGQAAAGRTALVMNVTATEAAGGGFVTAYPDGTRPIVSNLNVTTAGQTISDHAQIGIAADGGIRLYNSVATHLVADITGWFSS